MKKKIGTMFVLQEKLLKRRKLKLHPSTRPQFVLSTTFVEKGTALHRQRVQKIEKDLNST